MRLFGARRGVVRFDSATKCQCGPGWPHDNTPLKGAEPA
jgi:hypothetical protein